VTIGPVIEDGFYYDFSFKRPFTPEDLEAIEKKMTELAKKDEPVARKVMSRDDAVAFFKAQGEHYKAEIIASIPPDQDISLYSEGAFTDLCRGPHVPSTGKLKVFKLMKVAGAYWRGDSKNEMLQRIYGTAWATKEDLEAYLTRIEEAEKARPPEAGQAARPLPPAGRGPGMVFWHPNGWTLWQQVEQYMRRVYQDNGYFEVKCPQILDRSLWEKSGHWENFKENMFTTESEKRDFAIKPMNCPGHVQIFNAGLRSYRELPLRYGEFGNCHRNEPSGALHGIMRVRGFTQDDGHIFCTEEQIQPEVTLSTGRHSRSTRTSASPMSPSRLRFAPTSGWARTRRGIAPRTHCAKRYAPATSSGPSFPARAPFTGPRSNITSRTRSAGHGNAAPCRPISRCPAASEQNTWPMTTRGRSR
jgi:threonyl-tRNA synthetase